jgi:benzoylformate decarboxylase
VGDGSALFGIQALWTAAQWRLPVTYVVLNNRGYGALKSFGRMLGIQEAPGHDLDHVDFLNLAAGFGCGGVRVRTPDAFAEAFRESVCSGGATVLDVDVAPDAVELY